MATSNELNKIEIDRIVNEFFGIFKNKNKTQFDWNLIYKICIPEARIIKQNGIEQVVYNLDEFIQPRKELLTNGTLIDFEENETQEQTWINKNIAQRLSFYQKSGILNNNQFSGTGTKLFHFVNTVDSWKISFVTWEDN